MIAYEILVQTIADWKAGARPSALNVPPPAAPEAVEEYDSGMVDLDEGYSEEPVYAEGQGEPEPEPQYGEAEYATDTYEDDEGQ